MPAENPIKNRNFLSPTGFQISVLKLPHLEFFSQHVVIPGVSAQAVEFPNANVPIRLPGDKLNYPDLVFEFKVDEDQLTWTSIYDWIRGYTFPKTSDEYADLIAGKTFPHMSELFTNDTKFDSIFSDISVTVETNSHNPNVRYEFKDCFPTALGDIALTTTESGITHMVSSASFAYTRMEIIRNL